MLLAAGAHSKARATDGWEAVQVAALSGNTDLIRTAVLAFLEETDRAFARRLPGLQAALASVPDFTLRMSWEFSSWVPLLGRLLPSDTYSIHKRGSSLRLDTTLLGMTGLKWERGSVSLLLWGADMPRPGAMFVLDNEMKTAADARLAFTHPRDREVQDWVRKLLTQKQKSTDYWARDVTLQPVLRVGVLGGLFGKVKALALGDNTPRGRISEVAQAKDDWGGSASASAAASAAAASRAGEDGGEEEDGGAGGGGETPAACTDPRLTREDVACWSNCAVYEMRNLCVRDTTHPPLRTELKLGDWWKPEYSREATEEEGKAAARGEGVGAGAGASTPAAGAGADVAQEEAPEKLLKPLHRLLRAIRLGKINEANAASATLDQLEGIAGEDSEEASGGGPHTISTLSFDEYFGYSRPKAAAAAAAPGKAAGGSAVRPPPQKETGRVCSIREEDLTVDDKSLDVRVLFSKDFPLTTEQFLPIAEVMARTSKHAANIRRFFSGKLPKEEGFPVRFTLPVFPTITATITFDFCDAFRPPNKGLFVVPDDYKMGAYVERGFIRQL
jgi:hypothetical protein